MHDTPHVPDPLPHPPQPSPTPRPWGFWGSLGLTLCIIIAGIILQIGIALLFVAWDSLFGPPGKWLDTARALQSNGTYLVVSILATGSATVPLVLLAARWGFRPAARNYLRLSGPSPAAWFTVAFLTPVLYALTTWIAWLLNTPESNRFMLDLQNGSHPLLLIPAICLAAPVSEEMLFRGFLFRGVLDSRAGPVGAVLLNTALWSLLHFQYDTAQVGVIFLLGIYFSLLRLRSGSLWPGLAAHVLYNTLAVVHLYASTAFLSTGSRLP